MFLIFALGLFVIGAVLAVFATERLLEGLVSLAQVLRFSAFAIGAVLSGLEAENMVVGLAAGGTGAAEVSLGTAFGPYAPWGAGHFRCQSAAGRSHLAWGVHSTVDRGDLAPCVCGRDGVSGSHLTSPTVAPLQRSG